MSKKDKINLFSSRPILKIFIIISLSWIIVILIAITYAIKFEKNKILHLTLDNARSYFELIVTTRYWNAFHGGVYVPITEKTKPNPYLNVQNRDITTLQGKKLTLVNPAYMTRQISNFASKNNNIQFHITSLNPIRPANAPLPWEKKALKSFLKNKKEFFLRFCFGLENMNSCIIIN